MDFGGSRVLVPKSCSFEQDLGTKLVFMNVLYALQYTQGFRGVSVGGKHGRQIMYISDFVGFQLD